MVIDEPDSIKGGYFGVEEGHQLVPHTLPSVTYELRIYHTSAKILAYELLGGVCSCFNEYVVLFAELVGWVAGIEGDIGGHLDHHRLACFVELAVQIF